ncbi:polyribonucleotide nucleotidyltransferase 1, mitochondrial-like isoform X2 [Watersipora subatra]|uniref:polyribonucleotide nucleotidyltransferase 1, mitochondrial-like isoform X2 n=1 Tax=Watersipora subatra TaxID=2589382 RepID=UPI00355AED86
MFPANYLLETNISCNLLAYDNLHHPDVAAINAASAALATSNIPMIDAIGAVKVGWLHNSPILNPTREQLESSNLNLVIAARCDQRVVMLEGSANELPVAKFASAVAFGAQHAATVAGMIKGLANQVMPLKMALLSSQEDNHELQQWLVKNYRGFIVDVYSNAAHDKLSRDNALQSIKDHALSAARKLPEFSELSNSFLSDEFFKLAKTIIRERILDEGIRPDSRRLTDIRPLSCEVDIHKPLHGSALFQRGQTQVMATVTLDSLEMMTKTDAVSEVLVGRPEKNFMLHYEFPQYASGDMDTGAARANRREIGHGALAEKGLHPVLPKDFPFTVRVFAEVLESNGSSSMASICAGSMALLDAGVPLTSAAAGVAMGLITEADGKGRIVRHAILHDILGMEDYAGDIDFKIAGSKKGVTALQVDVKIPGVPLNIVEELFQQSSHKKSNWPATETMTVTPQQRSKLTGVAGVNIKHVQAVTGVRVTTNDDLSLQIFARNKESLEKAMAMLRELIEKKNPITLEFGNVYEGKIVQLEKNGAYVLIHPQMSPVFVRSSQLDMKMIHHSEAAGLPVGETVHLKYFGADPVSGEDRWSRRALLSPGGFAKRFLPKDDKVRAPSAKQTLPQANSDLLHDVSEDKVVEPYDSFVKER